MKTIQRHIIFILATLMIISTVVALELPTWYAVSQWEIEVCSKWGGSELAKAGAVTASPIALSQITLTLQAEGYIFSDKNIPNSSVENLYTLSWYIEPVTGGLDYAVRLYDNAGAWAEVAVGQSRVNNPGVGHETLYHPSIFTKARLLFGSNYLELPVIKK